MVWRGRVQPGRVGLGRDTMTQSSFWLGPVGQDAVWLSWVMSGWVR